MTVEVVPEQLYALARVLDAAGERAGCTADAVPEVPVGGPLGPAVTAFAETVSTAATCLAGELRWLGETVASAADAWLGLDGSLLAPRGTAVPR